MAVGTLGVSASAVFIRLSNTSPGTATFYRCLLALPLLLPLAQAESRTEGPLPGRARAFAAIAGALFAGDMLLWTQAIIDVGAGLSTVVVNMQVVLVPLLALLVDREPLTRRFLWSLPALMVGIVLTSGALGGGGEQALTIHAGLAALCYSGYLFLVRRVGRGGQIIQSYRDVIASAAAISTLAGQLWGGIDVLPGWEPFGWLLVVTVCGQLAGWLLVALSSPHLASHVGATLLLLTPIGAFVLGALILGERPTLIQLTGCVLILASGYLVAIRPPKRHVLSR